MANGNSNGNGNGGENGAGPLAWFTNGVARWLLLVFALAAVLGTGLPLALAGELSAERVFSAVERLASFIIVGLLPLLGARVMADAKDKSASNPPPPPPTPDSGSGT